MTSLNMSMSCIVPGCVCCVNVVCMLIKYSNGTEITEQILTG